METIFISKCCQKEVTESLFDEQVHLCSKCFKECEVEEVCAHCLGTRELLTMGNVYGNEPPEALIDTIVCRYCKKNYDN